MATRILCVTANDYLSDLVRYGLTREGFEARIARSGRDGLRMIRVDGFGLIILDATLPDMDGLRVFSSLRTFSQVPVVLLVDSSQDEDVIARFVRFEGPAGYIFKPFSVHMLIERVQAMLRQ